MKLDLSRIVIQPSGPNVGQASDLHGAVTAQARSAAFTPLPGDSFPATLGNLPSAASTPASKRSEGRAPAPTVTGPPSTHQGSRPLAERDALLSDGGGGRPLLRLGRWTESTGTHRRKAAFTMVEIALCLGIIAFALVAIIGVLPTGIRVQKDNREDTIINQEGLLLIEAIRSGSRGLDYLTNYFDTITISNSQGVAVFVNPQLQSRIPGKLLTNGLQIVSLLTLPKYDLDWKTTNRVVARVRAISGSAAEKTLSARDMAFAYQLIPEVVPLSVHPPDSTNYQVAAASGMPAAEILTRSNLWRFARNEAVNFSELRLTLQGPLIPKGNTYDVLGTPKTFRTLIGGAIPVGQGATTFVLPSTYFPAVP